MPGQQFVLTSGGDMLATVVLLAAIATAAVGAAPTQGCEMENINIMIDMLMDYGKHRYIGDTKTIINVEDTTLSLPSGEAEARNVTLLGLDSLYRSGDCFQCDTPEMHVLDLQLGFRFLELATGRLRLSKGLPFAASFRLHGASLKVGLRVISNSPIVDRLEVLSLGEKVEMSASNPELDGKDVTGLAKEVVLPYVNDRLDQLRQQFNKHSDSEDSRMVLQQLLS